MKRSLFAIYTIVFVLCIAACTNSRTAYPPDGAKNPTQAVTEEEIQVTVSSADGDVTILFPVTEPEEIETRPVTEPPKENSGDKERDDVYTIVVDGYVLSNSGPVLYGKEDTLYIGVPLEGFLTCLGASFEWQSDTIARISFVGKEYVFDAVAVTMVDQVSGKNIIMAAPGDTVRYLDQGGTFYLDHVTAHTLGIFAGKRFNMRIDREMKTLQFIV